MERLRGKGDNTLAHLLDSKVAQITPERQAEINQQLEASKTIPIEQLRMRSSGFSTTDQQRTLRNFKPASASESKAKKEIVEAVKLWPAEKRSFYIWGSPGENEETESSYGTGKSHLAKAYGNALIEQYGTRVFYRRMTDFVTQIIKSYKDDEMLNPIYIAQKADLFILDDIDKDGRIDKGVNAGLYADFWGLIDYISNEKKTVVITGNISINELKGWLGGSIEDRLSMCRQLEVKGPSGRREKTENQPALAGHPAPWNARNLEK